jgi:folylpolyglutamate synthase
MASLTDLTANNVHESDLAKLTTQTELASALTALVSDFPSSNVHVLPSIQHAVQVVRSLEGGEKSVDALVCGSLHLVGGVIEVANLADVALRC